MIPGIIAGALVESPGTISKVWADKFGWSGQAGVTTRTVPLSASLEEGDLVLIAYAQGGTSDAAINPPDGWEELTEQYSNGTTHDINVAIFYKFMGPAPDADVVLNVPATTSLSYGGFAMAFRDVSPADPFSAAPTTAGTTGNTPNPSAITPDTDGSCVVVCGFQGSNSGAWYNDPADLTDWIRWGINTVSTNNWHGAMGIALDRPAGVSFDPVSWTGGSVLSGNCWRTVTMALKRS